MSRVALGLGSNLQQPLQQIEQAMATLHQIPQSRVVALSPCYQSRPLSTGGGEQPDYINATALMETTLSPHALLAVLQAVETAQGRQRTGERWGARTLDLDILLFDDQVLTDRDLTIPHPHLTERPFVVIPLLAIWPEARLPDGRWLREFPAAQAVTELTLCRA